MFASARQTVLSTCVLTLALAAVNAAPNMTLYYASGFVNHVTMQGSFEVAMSTFDSKGHVLHTQNLTQLNAFMIGYVRVNPDRTRCIFAAQLRDGSGVVDNNVRLYQIALDGTLPAVPALLLDSTALLRPCEHSTHVACTQVDEFHPYHDDTGDGSGYIAFAYRAWNRIGFPAGSQALALLAPDGTVKPLTFNSTSINVADECPRFVRGSNGTRLLFIRETKDGETRQMAVLDVETSQVELLEGPTPDSWGGCVTPFQNDFLYISNGSHPMMQTVHQSDDSVQWNITNRFPVPRVNTSSATEALSMQYCDQISTTDRSSQPEAQQLIVCKAAMMDDKHGMQVATLDANTGSVQLKFSLPLPWYYNWDLTANSFHMWMD